MSESNTPHLPFQLPATLAWAQPLLERLFRWRYLRFATVGASGTVVNLAVLYVLQALVEPF
jgi:hypothetical protein